MRARGRHVEGPRDANQAALIVRYEQLYCSVVDLGSVGGGLPDLLIGCAGLTELAEVKLPGEQLRPNQRVWNERWRGSRPRVIRSADDVDAHVQDMRRRARVSQL
jgi:hypothetical protein